LPFSTTNQNKPRAKPEGYPIELKTIGDHIRKWRLDNSLLQACVARILNVSENSITGWESGKITPNIQQMPAITKMIGYLPIQIDTSTLGGEITYYRHIHGLTPEEFGKMVHADPSTVRSWETDENIPRRRSLEVIDKVMNRQEQTL
jgi:DNA-binding transcriptional regulator YiaG